MAAPDEASTYQSLTLDGASATNVESVYMVPLPRNTENRMTQEAEASETCDHKKSPGSSSQYFWLRTAVAVVVFAIAIAVILVASLSFAGYNNMQLTKATAESQEELKMKGDTISDLYQRIENLTEILQQMQMMVEHQNEETTRMLNSTRDQVNVLDILSTNLDQTRANVADLEMGVSSVNYTLRDYITEQIAETQSDISTHTSQISAITTDVSNLMNSQVSLSQSCHVERRGMGYDSPSTFFVEIETGSLPVNRTVSSKTIYLVLTGE